MKTLDLINAIEALLKTQEPTAAYHWHLVAHDHILKIFPIDRTPRNASILATLDRTAIGKGPTEAMWHEIRRQILSAEEAGLL